MNLIDLVRKPFIQEFNDSAECGCQPRGGFYLSAENFADENIKRMTTFELLEAISTALSGPATEKVRATDPFDDTTLGLTGRTRYRSQSASVFGHKEFVVLQVQERRQNGFDDSPSDHKVYTIWRDASVEDLTMISPPVKR